MMGQSEILSHNSGPIYYTLSFLEVHNCVAHFTNHGKLHKFGAEKPISWAKPAHFDFFTINFTVWSHILSTGGDALMRHWGKNKEACGQAQKSKCTDYGQLGRGTLTLRSPLAWPTSYRTTTTTRFCHIYGFPKTHWSHWFCHNLWLHKDTLKLLVNALVS